jgi:hypothetical protein
MGKMNAKGNRQKDTSVQGYWLYPDGKVFWGINVYRRGVVGKSVEKGWNGDLTDHFTEEEIEKYSEK